ncbi:type I-B CRISPR-associated protein Cas5b [Fervidobacterium thailandense]|uniref:Type I-B CRISPR-associated protein Cas5 n=1 Tax=Fervidobacterium thailandense TaxID=1008305 RepID=A0A1E3G1Z2_9BACT|nr:type I-B CRISPR-associated protein Cas5b [Fervidobacterium thailandense]ODN29668.1 hypothetical protein A4H02_09495 [Fervidobacterium thailandense]
MPKALVFQLSGKMAHFRKFYTNSSSLSYYFPPKTAVSGIIAAMLGLQRDSYYDTFSEPACITVEILTPLRKKIHVVNYLLVKQPSDIRGTSGGTQVPLEFVTASNFPENLTYNVYFTHQDTSLYNRLKETLQKGLYKYPVYLGITELPASVAFFGEFEFEERNPSGTLEICTPVPIEKVENLTDLMFENINVHKDKMPVHFTTQRTLKKVTDYIFRPDGQPIRVKLVGPIVHFPELGKNIVWL